MYAGNNTSPVTGFRPGVQGLAYFAGGGSRGGLGKAAGSAFMGKAAGSMLMGQLAPQADYTLQTDGTWTVAPQPSGADVIEEITEWATEPSPIASVSKGVLATAALVGVLMLAYGSRK